MRVRHIRYGPTTGPPHSNLDLGEKPEPLPIEMLSSVSQYGITWTFDQEYPVGQFVNGDYFVVGPVTVTEIDPVSTDDGTRVMNGSMINPVPGNVTGFDNTMRNWTYQSALNVGRPNGAGISGANPLVASAGSSLVSVSSRPDPLSRPQINEAAILTVVSEVPPDGSFRPPYIATTKVIRNASDVNYGLVGSLPIVGTAPPLETSFSTVQRPWIDHGADWNKEYGRPMANMGASYPQNTTRRLGVAALQAHLAYPLESKKPLINSIIQIGLDYWAMVDSGFTSLWVPNGGHASGFKWPILFAGLMLNDASILSIGPGDGSGTAYFGEDAQTFYVGDVEINRLEADYNWDYRNVDGGSTQVYDESMRGMPEWGIRHATFPTRDNAHWHAIYRRCCNAASWGGHLLSAKIMNAQAEWAYPAVFDFMTRYLALEAGQVDPFGYTVDGQRYDGIVSDLWQDNPFAAEMLVEHWSAY